MQPEVRAVVRIDDIGVGDPGSVGGDRGALLDGGAGSQLRNVAAVESHAEDVATDVPLAIKDDRVR